MENLVFTSTKPHFFQPMLHGFRHQLTIPVSFFKHLEGNKHATAELKSGGCERIWRVKIDCRRFTEGWKEFVDAHDLGVGNILVFSHEGDMLFHVMVFEPSGCERQYPPSSCVMEEDDVSSRYCDDEEEKEDAKEQRWINLSRIKKVENHSKGKAASSDHPFFLATVTISSLGRDLQTVPKNFAMSNGLNKRFCEIVIMTEGKRSWTLDLGYRKDGRVYMKRGGRNFCHENGLKAGYFYRFELIQNGKTPMLKFISRQSNAMSSRDSQGRNEIKTGSACTFTSSSSQDLIL